MYASFEQLEKFVEELELQFWGLDFHVEVEVYALRRFSIVMHDYFRSSKNRKPTRA